MHSLLSSFYKWQQVNDTVHSISKVFIYDNIYTIKLIHSSRPKEVSQSEIKISINFFWLGPLVRPSIHFYTKMLIFNVNLRFKYLTVFKSDFRLYSPAVRGYTVHWLVHNVFLLFHAYCTPQNNIPPGDTLSPLGDTLSPLGIFCKMQKSKMAATN